PLPLIHRIFQSFLLAFLALVCGIAGAQVVPGYDSGTFLTGFHDGVDTANRIVFQADGKYIVVGQAWFGNHQFAMTRFNADGTLDLSFGGGGSEVPLGTGDAGGTTMAIQSTGRILVGGYSLGSAGHRVFTVLAYTPTDTVDTTYGVNGAYVAADTGDHVIVTAMALLAND